MGLDFLNKKSWHPGSFENIEKVWLAEQEERDKIRKYQERQKKLKEERQNEDLKRTQVEAGLIPESYLKRMDWMYAQSNIKENTKEDFFGSILKPTEEPEPKKKLVPIVKDSTINEDYEAFVRFHEDPLVDIMKAQERAKAEVLDNPLKLKEIQREIEMLKAGKHKKHRKDSSASGKHGRSRSRTHRHHKEKPHYRHDSRSRSKERRDSKLGPKEELIQSYKQAKEMEALKKKQKVSYKHFTEQEKAEKVEEMRRAAMQEKEKLFALHNKETRSEKERVNPEFARTMRVDVYTKGKMTVADNVKRNMHHNQRLNQIRDQDEE